MSRHFTDDAVKRGTFAKHIGPDGPVYAGESEARAEGTCSRCRSWMPLYVNGLGTCADLGTAVAAHWGGTCPRFLGEVGT